MISQDDFEFALENTRVIIEPEQLIQTFGTTTFRFVLVTELMDEVHRVKVRNGQIEAERPRIVSPQYFQRMLLEGFGEKAQKFANWLEQNSEFIKILRYGFTLRKTDFSEHILNNTLEEAINRLSEEIQRQERTALIAGIDEAWEVCLLKFTSDLIRRSSLENINEWKRRGLI
ncbi:MAG: hypothetical protein N2035_03080 [Chthoniobacterales bacterium]|nr:hypothetical protein [Chthoniobacterales bacterium]